jgi:hypothetical protein
MKIFLRSFLKTPHTLIKQKLFSPIADVCKFTSRISMRDSAYLAASFKPSVGCVFIGHPR